MNRSLVIYRTWLESLPESQPLTMLAFNIRTSLPVWPELTQDEVKSGRDLRGLVCGLLRELEPRVDWFTENAIVGSLVWLTDQHLREHEREDAQAWLEHHQRVMSTGIDFLVNLSKEAILRKPEIDRAYAGMAESWKLLRMTSLGLDAVLDRKEEAERAAAASMDSPEVQAAKERIERAMRGERDEN